MEIIQDNNVTSVLNSLTDRDKYMDISEGFYFRENKWIYGENKWIMQTELNFLNLAIDLGILLCCSGWV